MINESYIDVAVREFRKTKVLGDRAMAQVSPGNFFAMPSPDDNSIAVIVKHVSGNMRSRWTDFLTSDGEKPGRNRDIEFEITREDTREALLQQWEAGWAILFSALEPLSDSDLNRSVVIRGEPLSVLQAINRQLTHYAYHVGQIVYLAKHYASDSWKSLSIPKGKSGEFNSDPVNYVQRA